MTARRVSAAAMVSVAGVIVLVVYLFWTYAVMAGAAWLLWRIYRRRLGWTPRPRRGRTLLELAAAGVAAWWATRKLAPELEQRAAVAAAKARLAHDRPPLDAGWRLRDVPVVCLSPHRTRRAPFATRGLV